MGFAFTMNEGQMKKIVSFYLIVSFALFSCSKTPHTSFGVSQVGSNSVATQSGVSNAYTVNQPVTNIYPATYFNTPGKDTEKIIRQFLCILIIIVIIKPCPGGGGGGVTPIPGGYGEGPGGFLLPGGFGDNNIPSNSEITSINTQIESASRYGFGDEAIYGIQHGEIEAYGNLVLMGWDPSLGPQPLFNFLNGPLVDGTSGKMGWPLPGGQGGNPNPNPGGGGFWIGPCP